MLTREATRRVYDRIGAQLDTQAFYEDPATDLLLRHGDFADAQAVFEFGCGTGRFAARLLADFLPPQARWRGVDLSPVMVRLAQQRLAAYAPRAAVLQSDGEPPSGEPTASCDRFVSCYVFDLLPEDEIRAVLREAWRMLRPAGLLCVAGLSTGSGPVSRGVANAWRWIQARRPALVGGCRPLDLLPLLPADAWEVQFEEKRVAFGVPSQALVARRRG